MDIEPDWMEFYKEFSLKLLEYKDNRDEIIDKIYEIYGEFDDINLVTLEQDDDENPIRPTDIDPFTIIALFNRGNTDEKRKNILRSFKDEFSISADVPTNFLGVPVVNSQKTVFYYFSNERNENDIDNLWEFYQTAINYANDDSNENKENFISSYDMVLQQKGIKWNITSALFWIAPDKFIGLDGPNRKYLRDSSLFSNFNNNDFKTPPSGEEYLNICQNIELNISHSENIKDFVELSYEAYLKHNKEKSRAKGIGDEDIETIKYWMFSINGKDTWDKFHNGNFISLDWGDIGNLKEFSNKDEIKYRLRENYNKSSSYKIASSDLWQFANEIKKNDVIFTKVGSNLIMGKCIVESDYTYDKSENLHVRKVKWVKYGEWEIDGITYRKTLKDITNLNILDGINELIGEEEIETLYPPYSVDKFLEEAYIDNDDYEILVNLLKSKKNLILQGAPGVGKTYIAKRLAYSIIGEKDVSRVKMVQFHQSYSYEDFIQGYRPKKVGDGFELRDGTFLEFCNDAIEYPEKDYFFIIDEINRGNISKIFGELFMLIENDKRGEKNKIQLLYSEDLFFIPENVYIIGLMNTADRSLAMIDYALRRRFVFFDLAPGFKSSGFKNYQDEINDESFNELIGVILKLNEAIEEDESLGAGFKIGHSFLCNIDYEDLDVQLRNIVDYEIIPLLKEYWFDDYKKVDEWSEKLKKVIE